MKGASESSRSFVDRLGFRLALFLTLAILPIGLIAVTQSYRTAEEARQRSEAALLGAVRTAVAPEQMLIQTALGAADALGHALLPVADDIGRCREMLRAYIDAKPDIIFAGLVDTDGGMRCASSGEPRSFAGTESFQTIMANPVPTVALQGSGAVTERPVVIVTTPVRDGADLRGFMALSIPYEELHAALDQESESNRPLDLTSFNRSGAILVADDLRSTAEGRLPADVDLTQFIGGPATAFTGRTRDGAARVFAVVPVVRGEVYAVGSWPLNARFVRSEALSAEVLALPVLMWLASVLVAYIGVHRLVVGHLGVLRSAMRRFALGNRNLAPLSLDGAPKEIRDIGETFDRMRLIITRDEADLENALHERGVLLKEVHHRVKNNLQLITSILSMQIRQTSQPDVRAMLRRVQERVMSLATVHRNLYQSADLTDVQADALLREIVNQMLAMSTQPGSNIALDCRLAPLSLDPDQAVPLSLAVSEALTNALKFLGVPEGAERPWIRIGLDAPDAEGRVCIEVANSIGAPIDALSTADGTGIGDKLMTAFASQLGATIERRSTADSYTFALSFRPQPLRPVSSAA